MEDFSRSAKPVALTRPRGAHRLEAFSLKLNRRLTLYRRCNFDQWIMIEVDAAARSFCERPGYVQIQEQRFLADFWVSYSDRQELVLLPGSATAEAMPHDLTFEGDGAIDVRIVSPSELAASRTWIDNWKRMLPCLMVTRGLLVQSLLDAVLNFVASPKTLSAIEREFSDSDPILARGSVWALVRRSRNCSRATSERLVASDTVCRRREPFMNRRKPELQAIDLVTWPGIAWTDLDTEARKVITQRMHALELFVQGEPVQAIEDSTGVNRRQLYRWLERGLSLHPDGCVFVSWLWLPQHRPSVRERECVPCTSLCCGVGMSPLRPQDTVSNQLPAS